MGMFSRRKGASGERSSSMNYLASVSDLMASLLFVFIVAVAVASYTATKDKDSNDRTIQGLNKEIESLQIETKVLEHQVDTYKRLFDKLEIAQKDGDTKVDRIKLLEKAIDEMTQKQKAFEQESKQLETEKAQIVSLKHTLTTTEKRLANNRKAREALLKRLQEEARDKLRLEFTVDASQGVLTIPESEVSFETGKDVLSEDTLLKLSRYGEIIAPILSCYVPETAHFNDESCQVLNPNKNTLEAIFIEGHTDNQRFTGDVTDKRNRDLSTRRSNNVYEALVISNTDLADLKNEKNQAVFSISGYGAERPVKGHEHKQPTNDAANRRIEMRFIFTEPKFLKREQDLINK